MAEEFVRKEHFEEFALRMDERFLGVEKRMEQGFAHAAKERAQNFIHLNQRFDSLEKRFDDLRTLMVVMYTPLAIAILGAVVKWFFSN